LNTNGDITKVAQALVMQPSAIATSLLAAKASPAEGKIAFAAIESSGSANYNTTANGYGFWFDSFGNVISWEQVTTANYLQNSLRGHSNLNLVSILENVKPVTIIQLSRRWCIPKVVSNT
jgi:hypothetical protein